MRKGLVWAVLLAAVGTAVWAQGGKEAKPETMLRWSFAGTKHLASLKELTTMNEVLALPETKALGEAVAQGLATRASARFNKAGETNAHPEIEKLLQPLLPDLWQNESRFQMESRGAEKTAWILGVKLAEDRSREWGRALAELAKHSKMQGASGEAESWTAKKDNYRLSFSKMKEWTLVEGGFGEPDAKASKEFRSSLEKRRGKHLLEAEVNSPMLAKTWGGPMLSPASKFTLLAEPKGGSLHSELMIDSSEDLGIKPEKWNVPKDLIREPLIGFTAIQGIQKKLSALAKFRELGAKETPNQLFSWAQSGLPFALSLAAEVKNPAQVVTNAVRAFKEVKLPTGKLFQPTNEVSVVWTGLPITKPTLDVAPAPHSSFLRGQFFPIKALGKNNSAPPELFEQLEKKNQIYYDWEITGERIEQWIPFWQLRYLAGSFLNPNNDAPSSLWLVALRSRVGNTVTEGTLETPRRVKLVRQSGLGFNALELLLLAHWIDESDLIIPGRRRANPPQNNVPAPALP